MTDTVETAAAAAVSDVAPAVAPDAASDGAASPSAAADAASHQSRTRGPIRTAVGAVWDGARTIALALMLSFAIRVVIVEPFHIPSESMEPTLRPGDFIGATKFIYGWSRASTSPIQLPMIPGRLFGRAPRRGELIVFRNRLDNGADYIKRVIGVPGDTVQMQGGVLHVNGEASPMQLLETFDGLDPNGQAVSVRIYEETLPGGCSHQIQHFDYADGHEEGQDDTIEYSVPAGHYFVMGDNRDASYDSRLPGRVGFVPAADIVGRAEFVFLSVEEGADLQEAGAWPTFRFNRTLKPLPCG